MTVEALPLPSIEEAPPYTNPYQPFGGAKELMYAREDEIIFEGPVGTGKTRGVLEKIHLLLEKYPGARGLLVRKTRESLTQSAMVTFEQWVLPRNYAQVHWRTTEQEYRYSNGSKLVVGGMDKSSRIMSTEYDIIFVPEVTELSEGEFEDLTTRARNGVIPYNQVIGDCNPGPSRHWVKRRWEEEKARRIHSNHQDNPRLWNHAIGDWTEAGKSYIRKLERLSGVRRKRLYLGLWVSAEGLVYPEYQPEVHLIDRFEIPPDWRRFCSVDFGFNNPFVCQWWAIGPDGDLFRYREIYMTHRTVRAHVQLIKDLIREEYIEVYVCDWDAEDKATMEEMGLPVVNAEKGLSTGIEAVKEAFAPTEGKDQPRLFFLRDSLVEVDERLRDKYKPLKTEDEIEDYVWANHETREMPVKKDDHGMDAMRYAVMWAGEGRTHGGIWV